jgi:hypothetical protein
MNSLTHAAVRRAGVLPLLLAALIVATLLASSAHAAPREPIDDPPPPTTPLPKPTPTPTPTPPPPAPTTPPGMKHVTVKLADVHATEIEDVCCFGLARDGFYVLGNVQVGENRSAITSSPKSIGNGQTVGINETLIDVTVPENAAIHLSMNAFDKDAGKVFENLPDVVNTIGIVCGLAAPFDPTGIASICTSQIPTAKTIAQLLAGFDDPDDQLGSLSKDWSLSGLPAGTSRHTWHFEDMTGGSWSDWNYDVTYEVTVS